ncbi:hypothetical protein T439DRAFT_345858, partial [Meredithblackwellia eburnea MCA 4105]
MSEDPFRHGANQDSTLSNIAQSPDFSNFSNTHLPQPQPVARRHQPPSSGHPGHTRGSDSSTSLHQTRSGRITQSRPAPSYPLTTHRADQLLRHVGLATDLGVPADITAAYARHEGLQPDPVSNQGGYDSGHHSYRHPLTTPHISLHSSPGESGITHSESAHQQLVAEGVLPEHHLNTLQHDISKDPPSMFGHLSLDSLAIPGDTHSSIFGAVPNILDASSGSQHLPLHPPTQMNLVNPEYTYPSTPVTHAGALTGQSGQTELGHEFHFDGLAGTGHLSLAEHPGVYAAPLTPHWGHTGPYEDQDSFIHSPDSSMGHFPNSPGFPPSWLDRQPMGVHQGSNPNFGAQHPYLPTLFGRHDKDSEIFGQPFGATQTTQLPHQELVPLGSQRATGSLVSGTSTVDQVQQLLQPLAISEDSSGQGEYTVPGQIKDADAAEQLSPLTFQEAVDYVYWKNAGLKAMAKDGEGYSSEGIRLTRLDKWNVMLEYGDQKKNTQLTGLPPQWSSSKKIKDAIARTLKHYRSMKEMIKCMTLAQREVLQVCLVKDRLDEGTIKEKRLHYAALINREGKIPGSFKFMDLEETGDWPNSLLYISFSYFNKFPPLFDRLCGTSDPWTGESHASNAPPQSAA